MESREQLIQVINDSFDRKGKIYITNSSCFGNQASRVVYPTTKKIIL